MKRLLPILFIVFLGLIACEKNEPGIPKDTEQTLFIYMPWSTNLLSDFNRNLSDLEKAIAKRGLSGEQVLVFLQTSETEASLFEITYHKGECIRTTLEEYTNPPVTTAEGITSILKDVFEYAPAKRYGMIVSCHGMSWLPVGSTKSIMAEKAYWDNIPGIGTRYFGGLSDEYQTEISDFVKGVKDAGVKMEFILFDDCYMSSIEVVYDLREIADHLIASPCEILRYGMPYHIIGEHLLGKVDYEGICKGVLSYYQNDYTGYNPYVTVAMTVCSEVEALAEIMKEINAVYEFDTSLRKDLQALDPYKDVKKSGKYIETCFFDFGDYVTKLCPDKELLQKFQNQFDRTVPENCRLATAYYVTNYGSYKLNTYSGMTISDPSISHWTNAKEETNWYKATH